MDLNLPEDRLIELGFEVLDYIYGELTIMKGEAWDEVFVDKDGVGRLGYDKAESKRFSCLAFLRNDKEFFLSVIPVDGVDYRRVLRDWVEERYKRKVDSTVLYRFHLRVKVEEHYKRNKKKGKQIKIT